MAGRRRFAVTLLVFLLLVSVQAQAATPISVVVKLLPGVQLSVITNLLGGTVIGAIPEANTYLLRLPSLPLLTPILRLLGVEWLEQNRGLSLSANPKALLNVPFGNGSDWYKDQPSFRLIRADQARNYSTGRGLIIADINSRVDFAHPALVGHLTTGYDFVSGRPADVAELNDQSTAGFLDDDQSTAGFLDDDQSTAGFLDERGIQLFDQSTAGFLDDGSGAVAHGTFCAGILAAIAPDATIMPLRVFDDSGNTDMFTIAKAIRYARLNGAQVINMSFGTLSDAKVLREAIDYARAGNLVLVASAGNNNTQAPQYPAAYSGVIAVASTDLTDRKAGFSNYGAHVFVDAPGKSIISAVPNGQYGVADGTSFSAPMVSAMAALIRSLRYDGTAVTISQSTVSIDYRNPQYAGKLGYGRIDILSAVD